MTVTVPRHARTLTLFEDPARPLRLAGGGALTRVPVAYERYGPPPADAEGTVFVCHALTGDSHVARHDDTDAPGWWDAMVGPQRPLDTDRYHVICANVLGGCSGTAGPAPAPAATPPGFPVPFPAVTVADMVTVHRELLRRLGIGRLHAVVGGSLGGMQALEWLLRHPGDAGRYALIATAARLSADNLAYNAIGRAAIRADPRYAGGRYDPQEPPDTGLGIARMIGHLTYMSAPSLETKFARRLSPPTTATGATSGGYTAAPARGPFAVERYMEYQGEKLAGRFDANSYLYLTAAMDAFDAFATPYDAAALAGADVHLFSFGSDRLFGYDHSRHIAARLAKAGVDCPHFHEESAPAGHDAFLMDVPAYLQAVRRWLTAPVPAPASTAGRGGPTVRPRALMPASHGPRRSQESP
ncbi:homoserine O-acetyltransferase MetX [Streptomyces albireticuli]|uniref:homoserine O-acetyltransferase MetX n=1 Tax=Streptomyces albireticuli TaxID=1940 RepID=UPI001E56CD91|nr:homoserine O-acetyltransferase [Streptomyces albireticuli]MCD9144877.1 homoserine O-acetyltransferase [Streptomyces albireticuli]MCD9164303.1 homoserine O-acetyltransferase [Streptomyces albireticuli]MCD9194014.1 homoserine O-acetyltransferase [Streptomyces albireticuli]